MPGWVPIDASSWSRDRMKIPTPWPEVLVRLDMRFWDDPKACSHRRRPSVRDLAKTYGWGKNRVNRWTSDRARWEDAARQTGRDTAGTERGHGGDTAGTSANELPLAFGQGGDTTGTRPGHDRDKAGTAPKSTRARSPHPTPPTPSESPPETRRNGAAAARSIHDHWRKRHPRAGPPNPSDLGKIRSRLTELTKQHADPSKAEADMRLLVDWIHTSPEAKWWQGSNPDGKKYLGITPLFKPGGFSDRMESAREWEAGPGPEVVGAPAREEAPLHTTAAEMREWMKSEGHEGPEVEDLIDQRYGTEGE